MNFDVHTLIIFPYIYAQHSYKRVSKLYSILYKKFKLIFIIMLHRFEILICLLLFIHNNKENFIKKHYHLNESQTLEMVQRSSKMLIYMNVKLLVES